MQVSVINTADTVLTAILPARDAPDRWAEDGPGAGAPLDDSGVAIALLKPPRQNVSTH
jgi:hypothetical protein